MTPNPTPGTPARPPRIPPLAPDERDERTAELLRDLRLDHDGEVLNIFATLVRHPKVFKRWSAFGGTLLFAGELSARARELLVLRTAARCRADYEWGQHARIGRDAGITDDELHAIAATAPGSGWDGWAPLEAALLTAADELHDRSVISDATWATLAGELDERQLIEVCMVVGQYHLVAFTLNSLGVAPEPGVEPLPAAR